MVTIRRELPDDAERVAGVHVRAWQAGYAGIIPAEVLDRLNVNAWAERRREWRTADDDHPFTTYVTEGPHDVEGFVSVGPYRNDQNHDDLDPVYGEILAIYVDPAHWGTGVGRALMTAAVRPPRRRRPQPVAAVGAGGERARPPVLRAGRPHRRRRADDLHDPAIRRSRPGRARGDPVRRRHRLTAPAGRAAAPGWSSTYALPPRKPSNPCTPSSNQIQTSRLHSTPYATTASASSAAAPPPAGRAPGRPAAISAGQQPDQVVHPGHRADQAAEHAGQGQTGRCTGRARTRHAQKTSAASTSTSHSRRVAASSRATSPRSDWLETNARLPTRSVSHSATVQNSRDAAGATAAASERGRRGRAAGDQRRPAPPGHQQVDDEDARRQLDRRREPDADARPSRRPPADASSRSAATRTSSSMLTWPKLIVSRIGSNAVSRATRRPARTRASSPRAGDRGSSRQISTTVDHGGGHDADRDRQPPRQERHRQHRQGGERRVREAVLRVRLDVVVEHAAVVHPVVDGAVVDLQVEEAVPGREHGGEGGGGDGERRPTAATRRPDPPVTAHSPVP